MCTLIPQAKNSKNVQDLGDSLNEIDNFTINIRNGKFHINLGSGFDLHSGYWQLPVKEEDCIKTAFCPGPGIGLYEFCRIPFGVTGGPSSFQRLMDKVLHGLPFATSYIDHVTNTKFII